MDLMASLSSPFMIKSFKTSAPSKLVLRPQSSEIAWTDRLQSSLKELETRKLLEAEALQVTHDQIEHLVFVFLFWEQWRLLELVVFVEKRVHLKEPVSFQNVF